MELTTVIDLINSVGFPIVACGALFWMNVTSLKQQRLILNELTKTVEHNTQTMKELNYQIGRL